MTVVRYEPWSLLDQLHGDFGRLLGRRAVEGAERRRSLERGDWVPAVDIKEEDARYVIHADVPGVDPAAIEVSMEDGVLTIKGERAPQGEEQRDAFTRLERKRGSFLRRFSLPDSADADAISASSRNGVLEIVIPKHKEVQARRIQIES